MVRRSRPACFYKSKPLPFNAPVARPDVLAQYGRMSGMTPLIIAFITLGALLCALVGTDPRDTATKVVKRRHRDD